MSEMCTNPPKFNNKPLELKYDNPSIFNARRYIQSNTFNFRGDILTLAPVHFSCTSLHTLPMLYFNKALFSVQFLPFFLFTCFFVVVIVVAVIFLAIRMAGFLIHCSPMCR